VFHINLSTSFRYSFVMTRGVCIAAKMNWMTVFPNPVKLVVNFWHGTSTSSARPPTARHVETKSGKSTQRNATVFKLVLCGSYGLGYTARVFRNHTASACRYTCRTTWQHRNDSHSSQSSHNSFTDLGIAIRSTSWDNSVAAKTPKPASLIFATIDPLGNDVTLYTDTWNQHITVGHVEMVGLDALVRQAVEDPYQIRQSTIDPTAYRFEFTDASTTVGVIVMYTGPILPGSETGKVVTAYPIQPTKYKSNVGPVVWTNPKKKGTP
jgi:hypothetical protein